MDYEARLGDLVEDRVSGSTGIVVALHQYLQGCDRMSVQPRVKKDGTLPETKSFDAPDLIVLKRAAVQVTESGPPGGPSKFMPESKPER